MTNYKVTIADNADRSDATVIVFASKDEVYTYFSKFGMNKTECNKLMKDGYYCELTHLWCERTH